MDDQPVNPHNPAILPPDGCVQPATSDLSTRAAASETAIHNIFLSPNGLRAIWRLLIYIALTVVFLQGATMVLRAFHVHGPKTAADVTWVNMSWSRALQF